MAFALTKMGSTADLDAQGRLQKETPERCLVIVRVNGELVGYELPDAQVAQRDNNDLTAAPGCRKHRVICDSDGTLWIASVPKPSPVIDKSSGVRVGDGYGLAGPGAAAGAENMPPPPPPLVPFAGLDRKAMPPSPAKPLMPQPSPIKPSPMKDRIDVATSAVASKAWGARQAKMSEFFGGAKAVAKPAAGGAAAPAAAAPAAPATAAPPAAAAPQQQVLGAVKDMDF